jgi:hypothetical protein
VSFLFPLKCGYAPIALVNGIAQRLSIANCKMGRKAPQESGRLAWIFENSKRVSRGCLAAAGTSIPKARLAGLDPHGQSTD